MTDTEISDELRRLDDKLEIVLAVARFGGTYAAS